MSGFQNASRGEQEKMVRNVLMVYHRLMMMMMIRPLYHMKGSRDFWVANKRRYCNRITVLTRHMVGA